MRRTISRHGMLRLFSYAAAAAIAMIALSIPLLALAGEPVEQKSFASPQHAVEALINALKSNNDDEILAILGPGSEDLIYSGDEVADMNGREHFLKAYETKNHIELEGNDRAVLIVGNKDYPLPIPIVRQGESWIFDSQAGRDEILNRRIGRNELHTIEVMHAYSDAQREYACMEPNKGKGPEFAQRLDSTPGTKDGLYWQAAANEPESPFGPLIAEAAAEGYTGGLDRVPPEPFHGYIFKILKKQGPYANGGAFDYVVDGKMLLGFAMVAYPAKYGVSGIMTFIENQDGAIYEKDLGQDTVAQAEAMTTYNPDNTWTLYKEDTEH